MQGHHRVDRRRVGCEGACSKTLLSAVRDVTALGHLLISSCHERVCAAAAAAAVSAGAIVARCRGVLPRRARRGPEGRARPTDREHTIPW